MSGALQPETTYYVGIDPGVEGSLGVVDGLGLNPQVFDFHGSHELCIVLDELFVNVIDDVVPTLRMVMVERVNAMPKQGVSSTFKFGRCYGEIIGVLAAQGLRCDFASPGVWKKHFSLVRKDKSASRDKAIQLWPEIRDQLSRKKDHGRAEALLIAEYNRCSSLILLHHQAQ